MDESNKTISIIFPSYNGEKFLNRNLNSIKELSNLNEIELIVIDNNSKDSSVEIIQSFTKEINLKILKQNTNLGFAKAINKGVLNANGEFIFITNQDVIFPPNFFQELKKIYKAYKKNHDILISTALVFEDGKIHYFGAKTHYLGFSYTQEIKQSLPKQNLVKATLRSSGGALFMEKKNFLDMGGFDSRLFMYYEDTDFSLRALRQGLKIYATNNPFLIHQKHDWAFTDFRYYLLERNRFIVFFNNINNFKKLFPFFIITEIVLLIHSILIRKFNLRIRIYYELLIRIKFIKGLREKSRKTYGLMPYQNLSKTIDNILMGGFKNNKIFTKILKLYNRFLKII